MSDNGKTAPSDPLAAGLLGDRPWHRILRRVIAFAESSGHTVNWKPKRAGQLVSTEADGEHLAFWLRPDVDEAQAAHAIAWSLGIMATDYEKRYPWLPGPGPDEVSVDGAEAFACSMLGHLAAAEALRLAP